MSLVKQANFWCSKLYVSPPPSRFFHDTKMPLAVTSCSELLVEGDLLLAFLLPSGIRKNEFMIASTHPRIYLSYCFRVKPWALSMSAWNGSLDQK